VKQFSITLLARTPTAKRGAAYKPQLKKQCRAIRAGKSGKENTASSFLLQPLTLF